MTGNSQKAIAYSIYAPATPSDVSRRLWDTIEREVFSAAYGRYVAVAGLPISTFVLFLPPAPRTVAFSWHGFGGCPLIFLTESVPGRQRLGVSRPGFSRPARAVVAVCLAWASTGARAQVQPGPAPAAQGQPAPAAPAAPARIQPRFTVLLDAAHGGDDSGGQIATAVAEKTVTLALSVRLRSLLTARGFAVVTTRESNLTLDADARAQIANHVQPAACLVLHATESGSGVHLFTSAIAPTAPARFLPWKTAQSAYISRSLRLAGVLNAAFARGAETVLPATLARATLPGLDSLACPAVVIEIAPERASDDSVAADVTDTAYQAQLAETITAAMLSWKSEWETEGGRASNAGEGSQR